MTMCMYRNHINGDIWWWWWRCLWWWWWWCFHLTLYLFLYQLLSASPYMLSREFRVDGVWSSVIVFRCGPWQKRIWPSTDVLGGSVTWAVSMETHSQPHHWALMTVWSMLRLISSLCNCECFLSGEEKEIVRGVDLGEWEEAWVLNILIYVYHWIL